ncbi:unnamed protein product [Ectocarpus sp. 12 AP-2014]
MIQLHSLPSRMTLVYGTLLALFPAFFNREKLLFFIIGYVLLLLFCTIAIQRTIIIFMVEGTYFPHHSEQFFNVLQLTNTMMDVNIAAVIPVGSKLVGYWLKSRKKLDELKVLNQKLTSYQNQFILFKKGSSKHKIFLKDVLFLESLKNNIKVVTTEKEHLFYGSISNLEEILKDHAFLRVHRSFVVNLNYVESFTTSSVAIRENTIPIGRKYKAEVLKKLKVD